jgi:hypothetical protein
MRGVMKSGCGNRQCATSRVSVAEGHPLC